ncbi:MAG: hypothetical protein M1496_04610 [Candidatus Thermoplasmatota archaeon]|jgi:Arc/MetJ-type ribon-helix-helix transcriptional regulator|nr:hypothetical protein [Candidatus Thermoplasmatota archaeon]
MISDSKDIKITLRISEDDLDEIDTFLENNPRQGSRSEFLRNCALNYISNKSSRKGGGNSNSVILSRKQQELIERMVDLGYYSGEEEAIKSIIEYVFDNGMIKTIFEDRISKYGQIEKSLFRNIKDEEDRINRSRGVRLDE